MAESKVECFIGVKTAQNSKKEDGIERKHKNVELTEEDVAGVILPREKPDECTTCYRSSTSN